VIRRLAHVALFLVGMFGTSTAIRHADPMPFFSWTRQKIVHLQSQVADVDTLFLGSSRFNYGVRPELFDARMAQLGVPTKSFNAALSGLRQVDHDEVVEWILRHRSPALKRVVIELHSWRQQIRGGYWFTDQEIELHTLRSFLPRMQAVLTDDHGLWNKVTETGFVLAHTLTNALCIGQAGRILEERLMVARREPLPKVHPVVGGGWRDVAAEGQGPMVLEHEEFVRNTKRWDRQLGSKIDDLAPGGLSGPAVPWLLRDQAARLRAAGIDPIYVVMPSWTQDYFGRGHVPAYQQYVRVLELDVVADNPALFARDHWYDASHFNAKGAEAFSPWLAERVAASLAQPVGAAVAPSQVSPSPVLLRGAHDAAQDRFVLSADCASLRGRIHLVGSRMTGQRDLGGVQVGVQWPPEWRVPMERTGMGSAAITLPGNAFPADGPAHFQALLVDGERTVAVSPVLTLPPRR